MNIILFEKTLLEKSKNSVIEEAIKEWVVLYKEQKEIDCVCGHKVKHSEVIYNKLTRHYLEIGVNCCKKYHMIGQCQNMILVDVAKKILGDNSLRFYSFELSIRTYIEREYEELLDKWDKSKEYYTVVPLYHLLNHIIDLKENYGFHFQSYIREIEQDIVMIEQYCPSVSIKRETDEEEMRNENESGIIQGMQSTLKAGAINGIASPVVEDDNCSELSLLSLDLSSEDLSLKNSQKESIICNLCKEIEMKCRCLISRSIFRTEENQRRIKKIREDLIAFKKDVADFTQRVNTNESREKLILFEKKLDAYFDRLLSPSDFLTDSRITK